MPGEFEPLKNGDVRFAGADGGVHLISVYEPDLIRARQWPGSQPDPAMRQTWSIADLESERPVEGLDRTALSPAAGDPSHL